MANKALNLKNLVFFSIKFNISSSSISKNILQYIRAISKCLNETVLIVKSRNQLSTSEMSPKKTNFFIETVSSLIKVIQK